MNNSWTKIAPWMSAALLFAGLSGAQSFDIDATDGYARSESSALSVSVAPNHSIANQASAGEGDLPSTFGIGVRTGGFSFGIGASARMWTPANLGLQAGLSFYSVSGVTVTQFLPAVIYKIQVGDRDSYQKVSWQPYVGGGLSIIRYTDEDIFGDSDSFTYTDAMGLGGVEVRFADVPKLGASGEVAFSPTIGGVYNYGGIAFSVLAHWYFQ